MASPLVLRVILGKDNAEKVILPVRPETVDELKLELKNLLHLTSDFRLQFEDPDFDLALINLVNMSDLPSRATITITNLEESPNNRTEESAVLPVSSPARTYTRSDAFVVPKFSYDVEHVLNEGNVAFARDGRTIKPTRSQKHNILECIASEMYRHEAYAGCKQIKKVAVALITQYPCLRDRSQTGYDGWVNSLSFKMGNYRSKLSKAGVKDVSINAGKRSRSSPGGAPSRSGIKRPRRGEVNFLPNYPSGESKDSLEAQRLQMIAEMQKVSAERDMALIYQLMQHTFALRREEIINSAMPIAEVKNRWPALFCEAQVSKVLINFD